MPPFSEAAGFSESLFFDWTGFGVKLAYRVHKECIREGGWSFVLSLSELGATGCNQIYEKIPIDALTTSSAFQNQVFLEGEERAIPKPKIKPLKSGFKDVLGKILEAQDPDSP